MGKVFFFGGFGTNFYLVIREENIFNHFLGSNGAHPSFGRESGFIRIYRIHISFFNLFSFISSVLIFTRTFVFENLQLVPPDYYLLPVHHLALAIWMFPRGYTSRASSLLYGAIDIHLIGNNITIDTRKVVTKMADGYQFKKWLIFRIIHQSKMLLNIPWRIFFLRIWQF